MKNIEPGQSGIIDGISVKAVYPENQIDKCHGCIFDSIEEDPKCTRMEKTICHSPDRIFKRINVEQSAELKPFPVFVSILITVIFFVFLIWAISSAWNSFLNNY